MYWIFLILFIIAVLVPDIVREPYFFLSETRVEEILIFILGTIAFLVFIEKDKQLIFHRKEKEKDQRKINQTVKDLVESYSYIGEVNRKMDLLMNIALGITDRSVLDQKREREIYDSIIEAAKFLMKADCACLRFVDLKARKTVREVSPKNDKNCIKAYELTGTPDDISVKKNGECLSVSSPHTFNNLRAFLVVSGYDSDEEKNTKNVDILKVLVSQAFFVYSYAAGNPKEPAVNNH